MKSAGDREGKNTAVRGNCLSQGMGATGSLAQLNNRKNFSMAGTGAVRLGAACSERPRNHVRSLHFICGATGSLWKV